MPDEQELGRKIELKMEQEQQIEVQKAVNSEDDSAPSSDSKSLVIMLLVVVGIFVVAFGGFKVYDQFTAAAVINIDELHKQNLEGDLNDKEGYIYNGYSFVFADGLWWTEVNPKGILTKIPLRFSPKDLENITIKGNLNAELFNSDLPIYLSLNDPGTPKKYYNLAIVEIQANIVQGINRQIIGACAHPDPDCVNVTIINCDNETNVPIIELNPNEKVGIQFKNNCIKISGEGQDILRATDRVLLRWYGVMD